MNSGLLSIALLLGSIFSVGSANAQSELKLQGKWFTPSQIQAGEKVFQVNCQECHGERGQGKTPDWRTMLPDGSLPPPPLNGTAHSWHHPLEVLYGAVQRGGAPLGGTMPAFNDKLTREEKIAVLAYIQSLWSEEIYAAWSQRNLR